MHLHTMVCTEYSHQALGIARAVELHTSQTIDYEFCRVSRYTSIIACLARIVPRMIATDRLYCQNAHPSVNSADCDIMKRKRHILPIDRPPLSNWQVTLRDNTLDTN